MRVRVGALVAAVLGVACVALASASAGAAAHHREANGGATDQARLRDRARERERGDHLRRRPAGALFGADVEAGGRLRARLLRDRTRQPRQLHRDGERPAAQPRHSVGLPHLLRLHTGHASIRRSRPGTGVRLSVGGEDGRQPARGEGRQLARLYGGHGQLGRHRRLGDLPAPGDRGAGRHPGGAVKRSVRHAPRSLRLLPRDHRPPDLQTERRRPETPRRRPQTREDHAGLLVHHPRPLRRRSRRELRRPLRPRRIRGNPGIPAGSGCRRSSAHPPTRTTG